MSKLSSPRFSGAKSDTSAPGVAITQDTAWSVAVAALMSGALDAGCFVDWAKSATTLDPTDTKLANDLHTLAGAGAGINLADCFAIIAAQSARVKTAAAKTPKGRGVKVGAGNKGGVTLIGALAACGKKGFDPSFAPAVWVLIAENLAEILAFIRDNSETVLDADAKRSKINPAWLKGREEGKSYDELREAGIKRFVEGEAARAGQSALDFGDAAAKRETLAKVAKLLA